MKAIVGTCLGAALALSIGVPAVQHLGPAEASAYTCYSIYAEVEKSGSYYRHIVWVENDCEYWLQCSVWTDVDPQPPKMFTVGPDMSEHAETNGRSRASEARAFGACHRK